MINTRSAELWARAVAASTIVIVALFVIAGAIAPWDAVKFYLIGAAIGAVVGGFVFAVSVAYYAIMELLDDE